MRQEGRTFRTAPFRCPSPTKHDSAEIHRATSPLHPQPGNEQPAFPSVEPGSKSFSTFICAKKSHGTGGTQNFIEFLGPQRCGPNLHLTGRLKLRGARTDPREQNHNSDLLPFTHQACPDTHQASHNCLNSTLHSGQSCPPGARLHEPPLTGGPAFQEPPFQILQVSPE